MQRKLLLLFSCLAATAAVALTAQLASAHSRPIRFDPAPGTILNAAPAQVMGWFTQPLRRDPNWNFLQVTDAQGARVDTGEAVLSADRKQMTVSLRPGLGEGRYLVTWRTWDDNDGRIFGDCYAFFIGQAAADASISGNTRLDGGGTCGRIDISGTNGTPVAGGTPQATATPEDHADEGPTSSETPEESSSDDSDGVPAWALAAGVIGGIVVGGVGGRVFGKS
jgi:methionine-rich copper-binding protein CopC